MLKHNYKLALLMLFVIPVAAAFEYSYGENVTIYPVCFNSSDGQLLGTSATLTVRNESEVFYVVGSVENLEAGRFKHHLHNLSNDHCYSLLFNCTTAGTYGVQWGMLCVNQSTSSIISDENAANNSGLATILSMVGMIGLFLVLNRAYSEKYPVTQIFVVPMIMLSLMIMTFTAARLAEAGGAPVSVSTAMDMAYLASVVSMIVTMFTASYATLLIGIQVWTKAHENQVR